MVENLQTGSPTKFVDLKFGDSHFSEIWGIAIADWARKFADLKKNTRGRPPLQICYWCQWYLWRIFEQIWNGLNKILRGLGETDSWKKPEVKNLVALPL
jgi:hypothetical protein